MVIEIPDNRAPRGTSCEFVVFLLISDDAALLAMILRYLHAPQSFVLPPSYEVCKLLMAEAEFFKVTPLVKIAC